MSVTMCGHRLREVLMQPVMLVDTAGRRRSPATLPGHDRGQPPRSTGMRYPADPPTVEEIICVMRSASDDADGVRLRGLIVVLWRAALRTSEALALRESDLDASRGAILCVMVRVISDARLGWTAGHGSSSLRG
jgi:hypothetical protein